MIMDEAKAMAATTATILENFDLSVLLELAPI
jgi:hypothetical protein